MIFVDSVELSSLLSIPRSEGKEISRKEQEMMLEPLDLLLGGSRARTAKPGAQRPTVAELEARNEIVSRRITCIGGAALVLAVFYLAVAVTLAATGNL